MAKKMLIDATHPEETRVAVVQGNKLEDFDFESAARQQLNGNIYLAKVTRIEPSLQAAFVEYGGNRHGFLAFSEIHPDYYQIPVADRLALLAEDAEEERRAQDQDDFHAARQIKDDAEEDDSEDTAEDDAEDLEADDDDSDDNGATDVTAAADAQDDQDENDRETGKSETSSTDDSNDSSPADVSTAAPAIEDAEETEARGDNNPDTASDDTASGDDQSEDPDSGSGKPALLAAAAGDSISSQPVPENDPVELAKADQDQPSNAAQADDSAVEQDTGRDSDSADTGDGNPTTRNEAEQKPSRRRSRSNRRPRRENNRRKSASSDQQKDTGDVESLGREDALDEVSRPRANRRRYKIQEVIKKRQILLVQVLKDERGTKGAALTTYLSIAGRYCVLMPNTARGGGISRKIGNAADRKRLKAIATDLDVPEGMGLIIRTAGANRTKAEIKRDFEYLLRQWEEIRETTLKSTAPSLINEEGSLIKRAIRDLYDKDIELVLVEGEEGYKEAKGFMRMLMPSHAKKVQPHRDQVPLFHKYQIEAQLDSMFDPTVRLKSGGYIVIDPTEALVSIDVNSGKATREANIEATALRTNLEAAEEVARQLRLRDLAGLVVIDFIDMENHRNNRAVEKRIKECLKSDRARIQVGRISAFGLLEMSRQRLRQGVVETTTSPCPNCNGTGLIRSVDSLALHILRGIEEEAMRKRHRAFDVTVPTEVAIYILNQKRDWLEQIETRFGLSVFVIADSGLQAPNYEIKPAQRAVPNHAKPAAERPAEVEEDDDEKPRRPRRRRPRSGADNEENTQSQADDEGDANDVETADSSGNEEEDQKPKKRRGRRGRRGGRNRDNTQREPASRSGDEKQTDSPVEAATADGETGKDDGAAQGDKIAADDADKDEPVLAEQADTDTVITTIPIETMEPVDAEGVSPGVWPSDTPDAHAPSQSSDVNAPGPTLTPQADAPETPESAPVTGSEESDVAETDTTDETGSPEDTANEEQKADAPAAEDKDAAKQPKRGGWWQRRFGGA